MHSYGQIAVQISHLKTLEIYSLLFGALLATFVCALLVRTVYNHGATKRGIFLTHTASIFEWMAMCFFGVVHITHIYVHPQGVIATDLLPITITALVVLFITKTVSDVLLIPSLLYTPIGLHKQRKIHEILVLRYGTLISHTLSLSSWYVLIGVFALQSIRLVSTPLIIVYAGLIIFGIASSLLLEHYIQIQLGKKKASLKTPSWMKVWNK